MMFLKNSVTYLTISSISIYFLLSSANDRVYIKTKFILITSNMCPITGSRYVNRFVKGTKLMHTNGSHIDFIKVLDILTRFK